MSPDESKIRISKVARELNIGLSTIVNFLKEKGFDVETSPNAKISKDIHQVLLDEYQSEKIVKEESKLIGQDKITRETITLEKMVFKTIIKKELEQKSIHKKLSNKTLTEIISGPAKGTIVETTFEQLDGGTKVSVNIDLKLSLKAKILQPIIKKYYKSVIAGILYKINTVALESHEVN